MEPLPRGANFQRAKLLWEIGLHIAGDPKTPYFGPRDMCISVGSGSAENFKPKLRMSTGSPIFGPCGLPRRLGNVDGQSVGLSDSGLSRHRIISPAFTGSRSRKLPVLGPLCSPHSSPHRLEIAGRDQRKKISPAPLYSGRCYPFDPRIAGPNAGVIRLHPCRSRILGRQSSAQRRAGRRATHERDPFGNHRRDYRRRTRALV